jgi:response regulator RpfG family c-di-GMP phosphodiesterase
MDGHGYTKKATILVVDDTPANLTLMSNLFKDDYKVKIANDGEAALKIAASGLPPDLILLDIMMPGMDGYEVCRRLKHDPKTMNIPVIFVTAMIEVEDEKKGLELGAIDYITKPISPPIVMARVKNHLALKAMADFLRDQNDWDTAERLAFTLKGVSGKVNVTGLQQFADKLDVAIRERRARKQADDVPDGLTTQPDNLIAQLEQNLLEEQDKTIDRKKLKSVCDKLEALLVDEDAEAGEVLDANADLLNAAFRDHYRKIEDGIRSCDFEAALAELRAATATAT